MVSRRVTSLGVQREQRALPERHVPPEPAAAAGAAVPSVDAAAAAASAACASAQAPGSWNHQPAASDTADVPCPVATAVSGVPCPAVAPVYPAAAGISGPAWRCRCSAPKVFR